MTHLLCYEKKDCHGCKVGYSYELLPNGRIDLKSLNLDTYTKLLKILYIENNKYNFYELNDEEILDEIAITEVRQRLFEKKEE